MPELPEVEAIRRHLATKVMGVGIQCVTVHRRDVVRDAFGRRRGRIDAGSLGVGRRIEDVDRRGKQLILRIEGGVAIVIRLGMSGRVDLHPSGTRIQTPHRHVVWTVAPIGSSHRCRMEFVDPRRFGGVHLATDAEDLDRRLLATLGPEAHLIDVRTLESRLARTNRAIKVALLDQKLIAGIGNIYADEALFGAGLHPTQPAATLTQCQVERLARQIRWVLQAAIEAGGSTIQSHSLPDGRAGTFAEVHRVYGRAGRPCRACGATLRHLVLAARSTTFCPQCQPSDATSGRTSKS